MNPLRRLATHPPGLSTLFFTEMWERFSYYGMRALLVLYLVNALQYERADALEIYARYTMLVYLTPILGGLIADRWLGHRRSVLVGALLMCLGHFAMAVPALLHIALGLLILGNGFFKPNISTLVGRMYEAGDPRRDSGFTLFYMGINLGALFSPLVSSSLGEKLGWHYGFAAAGFGMLTGMLIFVLGQRRLAQSIPGSANAISGVDWRATFKVTTLAVAALVIFMYGIWPLIANAWNAVSPLARVLLTALVFVLIAAISAWRSGMASAGESAVGDIQAARLSRTDIERMVAILIMAVFVVFFWMGFEQAGGTMNLFADKLTDRAVFGWEFPAGWFQSVNPLYVVLLAPLFSVLWLRLDSSRFALSVVHKQAVGMVILGLGFVVLAVAQQHADTHGRVGPQWLLIVYLLHTLGELCLSPTGLSMVTKLAPQRFLALMMGVWFVAVAIASYLAGTLESILAQWEIPLYWFLVVAPTSAGVLLFLIAPLLHRLMHGVR